VSTVPFSDAVDRPPWQSNINIKSVNHQYVERNKSSAFLDLLSSTELDWKESLPDNLKSLPVKEQEILDRCRQIQMQHLNKEISISKRETDTAGISFLY